MTVIRDTPLPLTMEKSTKWHPGEIHTAQPKMGFALADENLRVTHHNEALAYWLELCACDIIGQPLIELFPELIGLEQLLTQLAQGEHTTPLTIPRTYRYLDRNGEQYFDLQLEAFASEHGRVLISMTNVTQQAFQEQRLRQQRNDVMLLSEQVHQANDQLAYLLKRFVPPQIAQGLIESRNMPQPGSDQHRLATLLFADIRNFTQMAEQFSPEQTLDILNLYIEVVNESAIRYGGSLVQIVGDMVMYAFNLPQEQPDHVWQAVQTALAMRQDLVTFLEQKPAHIPSLQFGIGIHTGMVTTGYLGVKERYQYTVMGDTTNVAYHLCARAAGDQIIISEATLAAVSHPIEVLPLGEVALKRRRQLLHVYELVRVSD